MVQFLLQNYETILKNYLPIAMGRDDGGQVVIIAYDLSSNPAEFHIFLFKLPLKRTKINKKRPGLAQFFNYQLPVFFSFPFAISLQ